LPRDYVDGQRQRIEVYRRLARIRSSERLEDFRQELRDRFGPIPEPAEWALRLAELRLLAARWQIGQVRLEGQGTEDRESRIEDRRSSIDERRVPVARSSILDSRSSAPSYRVTDVVLEYRSQRRIAGLAQRSGGRVRIVDDHSAYFRLRGKEDEPPQLYAVLKDLLRLPERPL
jgi:transcription-repair coupling factor (superfamily II helicase)